MVQPEVAVGSEVEEQEDEALDALVGLFTYHPPKEDQPEKYEALRSKALELAKVIHYSCPAGPDRTHAIRQLRETVMTANAAIANDGASYR